MASKNREKFDNPVIEWVDSRLPIFTLMNKEYGVFPTPKNFNYFWNFGAIAMVVLVTMILTGIFLAMNYTAHTDHAFDSVERIMRDVNFGWLIRYIHMNGASFFFIAVYIHIFRGMYYGSYKQPRELLWMLGVAILLLMMATAFMGYVLPWGQMSYWGATVITNLFSAIPLVGDSIVTWLWGGFSVDNPTLNRFFALHYLLPFVIFAVVFLHVWALHVTGSNNPLGIDVKSEKDTIPFHPYYTMKDSFGIIVFFIFFAAAIFFMPNAMGHPDNYVPANPLVTPAYIVPEWYFLAFYAILRAITFDIIIPFTDIILVEAKLGGVIAMFGAIALLFILPFIDQHPVRSARFRPWFKITLLLLWVDLVFLTFLGGQPAEGVYVFLAQLGLIYYYSFFLVILPLLNKYEKALPLPKSIHEDVLAKKAKKKNKISALVATISLVGLLSVTPAYAAGESVDIPKQEWSFSGITGTYDKAALQRGFQIYREVCSSCHAMKRVHYRNLSALGYSPEQIKTVAAEYTVTDGPNDEGEMFDRAALPADHFNSPFANENAARYANGGAYPPDLSLITKARVGGADYIYALLTGYTGEEKDGKYYNKVFPGNWLSMAPPLADGQVMYSNGDAASIEQAAKDVATFLTWAAEPEMEQRKRMGIKVVLFLIAFAGIMYAVKKKIWRELH